MKTVFFTKAEIKKLKSILHTSGSEYQKILRKIEKAENRQTDYLDLIFEIYKIAHKEVAEYFKKFNTDTINYEGGLYVKSQIDSISYENGGIYATCTDGNTYDISYTDRLLFLAQSLKKQKIQKAETHIPIDKIELTPYTTDKQEAIALFGKGIEDKMEKKAKAALEQVLQFLSTENKGLKGIEAVREYFDEKLKHDEE
ncbi:hypothetical protein [Bacteroides cellulosilyticus]|uniref:hypothetical protein n=1 Tax=Bacteroides cellulosilyticus TaxID=246787 RepID=UPI0035655C40